MQAKLIAAARDGRKAEIIKLLKDGVDVNCVDEVSHVIMCIYIHE